ncbi:MAG: hypothetical protein R3C18_23760 [Planctomycetaceae bacterium]
MSSEHLVPNVDDESDMQPGETISDSNHIPVDAGPPISIWDVVGFLFGRRVAILKIAHSSQAIWLGFAFVILAGLFREYDQEDLLHEPWYLFIPLVASLALSFPLAVILRLVGGRDEKGRFAAQFQRVLTCVWMCAPMAALYAIPVERMNSAYESIQWNIAFLAVVSLWRVVLMTRILAVLCNVNFLRMLGPVMLLADTLAMFAMLAIPIPLIQVMGGIALSNGEELINDVRWTVLQLGFLSWLFWLFLIGLASSWNPAAPRPVTYHNGATVGTSAWRLVAVLAVLMTVATFYCHPEQRRRYFVESMLKAGPLNEGVEYLVATPQHDFPPHWDPPPRLAYRDNPKLLFQVLDRLLDMENPPDWLIETYGQKLVTLRGTDIWPRWFLTQRTNEELETLVRFLERYPKWRQPLDSHAGDWGGFIVDFVFEELEREEGRRPNDEFAGKRPKTLLLRLLNVSNQQVGADHFGEHTVEEVRRRLLKEIEEEASHRTDEEPNASSAN